MNAFNNIEHTALLDKLRHVPEAEHRSQNRKGCMAGTRVSILGDLVAWSIDANSPPIFWLCGMAGTGKSAIAWSFCELLHKNSLLGGSFFCLRGSADRGDAKRIISSLARFFARLDPVYETSLVNSLKSDPDMAYRAVDRQMEYLLCQPLTNQANANRIRRGLVFVLDALDECADEDSVGDLLKELVASARSLPVKFLITSRPESHIQRRLETHLPNPHQTFYLHNVEADAVAADIKLYLTHHLEEIRDQVLPRPGRSFPEGWPSPSDLDALTKLCGSLFIYAFTAVQYIRQEDPVKVLREFKSLAKSTNLPTTKNLQQIYSYVLEKALDTQSQETVRQILYGLLATREPLSISSLSQYIGVEIGQLRSLLDRLQAVVYVPIDDKDTSLSTFHASFGDFVTSQAPEHLRIDLADGHAMFARACLKIMQSDMLHFNVSQCPSSHFSSARQTLAKIPPTLLYSCIHWSHHLASARDPSALVQTLRDVFLKKFLFWLEVLSATRNIHIASLLIMKALTTTKHLPESMMPRLKDFLRDANEFVIYWRTPIETSVPHIYLSALPSLHPTSEVYQAFIPMFSHLPVFQTVGFEGRRDLLLHLRGHEGKVRCVAVSPDGTRIASCSDDETIRVWNTDTGELVLGPLKGHTNCVRSVVFSPDGSCIISGGDDSTIRIWSSESGEEVVTLQGQEREVRCVAVSRDGYKFVSGSCEGTIRLWDMQSAGAPSYLLGCHEAFVTSVLFTPDGCRVFSCSRDATIRAWDTSRSGGPELGILRGHARGVNCIAISPDGMRICSGSDDRTIRVWSTQTYEVMIGPFESDTGYVINAVAYSPDGSRIASAWDDHSICIWDSSIVGPPLMRLTGHTGNVNSVVFTPDGSRVVSGSSDESIRVWKFGTDRAPAAPNTAADMPEIYLVGYSFDGSRIISSLTPSGKSECAGVL